jgi:hypothetical protein
VCSTFTRGAKPATRRVADGERMNPQGKGGAFAPDTGDDEHQGDKRLAGFIFNLWRGAAQGRSLM